MECQEICGDCHGCMDAMNGPFAAFRSINDTKTLASAVRTACLQVRQGRVLGAAGSSHKQERYPFFYLFWTGDWHTPCYQLLSTLSVHFRPLALPPYQSARLALLHKKSCRTWPTSVPATRAEQRRGPRCLRARLQGAAVQPRGHSAPRRHVQGTGLLQASAVATVVSACSRGVGPMVFCGERKAAVCVPHSSR